ncbi:MAG: chorismate-binding protein, partial [Bacteroidales bacterium]|nr:chorismate-binding protein [Bacteroidales bacterium]
TLNKMILLIKNQRINKGVLSRIKTIKRDHKNINQVFLQLTKSYPTAFVYLALSPNGEMWCGASPETLATYNKGIFRTVALAGTQLINDRNIDEIKWDSKEQEEQVWVQKHISTIFNEADIAYEKSKTYTAQAGHIVHLKNDFRSNTTRKQATELILKLQPTPAVCGTPTLAAKKIILDLETHERKYYSGYIGILGSRNIQLFVNLRCMLIDGENYYLFVGGGITADSHAESEWLETENKAQILESVLSK